MAVGQSQGVKEGREGMEESEREREREVNGPATPGALRRENRDGRAREGRNVQSAKCNAGLAMGGWERVGTCQGQGLVDVRGYKTSGIGE